MSKAFVKENDDGDEDDSASASMGAALLPAGAKNYMTPVGARRLSAELEQLLNSERPKILEVIAWAAGNGDRSENADYQYGRRRLREIDRRVRYLTKRLDILEVIDPAKENRNDVRFGATVRVCDEAGIEKTYTIVGVDETDPSQGLISWVSPIARSLMQAKAGDTVHLKTPKGDSDLEIIAVQYLPQKE